MAPTPLETERLRLRPFVPDDLPWLIELDGDPEVMRYISGTTTPPEEVERVLPLVIAAYDTYAKAGTPELGTVVVEQRSDGEPLGARRRKARTPVGHARLVHGLRLRLVGSAS